MSGREIVDAEQDVTINIRQHHIDDAEALNGERCVAGRCTLQALDAVACWFYRSKAYIVWDDDGPIVRYQLSMPLIRNVILVLDDPLRSKSEIKPGLYTLQRVPPGQRLGLDRRRREGALPRKTREDRGHRVMGRVTAARHV